MREVAHQEQIAAASGCRQLRWVSERHLQTTKPRSRHVELDSIRNVRLFACAWRSDCGRQAQYLAPDGVLGDSLKSFQHEPEIRNTELEACTAATVAQKQLSICTKAVVVNAGELHPQTYDGSASQLVRQGGHKDGEYRAQHSLSASR